MLNFVLSFLLSTLVLFTPAALASPVNLLTETPTQITVHLGNSKQ